MRRTLNQSEVCYPTISEFKKSRRTFLKKLALGSLAVGVGHWTSFCASAGEGGENHPPGTAPEPDFYKIRVPIVGDASAYGKQRSYFVYYVEILTYDQAAAEFFTSAEEQAGALSVFGVALLEWTCEDLENPEKQSAIEQQLMAALATYYEQKTEHSLAIEDLNLLMSSCVIEDDKAGGVRAPENRQDRIEHP